MIRRAARRLAAALTVGLATTTLTAGVATAADPVTVGISDVVASGPTVTGVLTLRSKSSVQVDPASVKATIDGLPASATVKQAPTLHRRAMLVIDTSGSMGAAGMSTVRAATAQYLKDVPSDVLVGVVTFADTAGVDLAPTTDRAAVQRVVNGLAARGDTSLYAGMQHAITALGKTGDRSIVLLSDGADTMADNRVAAGATITKTLGSAGVRSDVVQFKTEDPDAVGALKGFAGANGGSVVPAGDTAAVTTAFHESAKALDAQVQFTATAAQDLTGSKMFTIAGVAGGSPFSFQRAVVFGAASPGGSNPSSAVPAGAATGADLAVIGSAGALPTAQDQSWLLWLAALLISIALFAGIATLTAPTLQTRRERRVESIDDYVTGPLKRTGSPKPQPTALTEQLIGFGDRFMAGRTSTTGTMALIERADLPFRAGEWFVIQAVAAVVGASLGAFLLLGGQVLGLALGVVLGGLLGLVLPTAVLRFLADRRARAFERVLPDVLILVATSLRSGFGLPQALDAVARDAADPAAKEFSRALAETRIGTDIADALERMSNRMDSTNMRWAVMAIRIQREVGGNLADTLKTTAETLRERESLQRQVRTLSAEGRLSAYILIALPIGMFCYMMMVNYEYISRLWTNPLGIVMALIGVVLLCVGVFWMRRVVRIEV